MSIKESSIESRLTRIVTVAVLYPSTRRNNSIRAKIDAQIIPRIVSVLVGFVQSERRKAAIEELGRMKRRAEQFQDMAHRKVMATTLINIVDRIDELESNSFSAQIVESNKKIRKDFKELESNTEKEK